MQLNQRQVDIINELYRQNIGLAKGDDDQRRLLTRMIAEQFCFEFGADWGTKASSPNNPQSKDAIVFRGIGLSKWDWQNGATREPQVHAGQEGEDITGQFFIAVPPVNHLGAVNNPPDNTPNNPPSDNTDVLAAIKQLTETQKHLAEMVSAMISSQADILQRLQVLIDKPTTVDFPPLPDYVITGNTAFNKLFGTVVARKK